MPEYQCKLQRRESVAERTMAFHLVRPKEFDFKAGQTVDVTLLNPPETDAEGNTRTFSIVSAPADPELIFATRMRDSAFKRSIAQIPLGTAISVNGPMGSFTLHKNTAKPAVLLAGGIGVTPFHGIVRQAAATQLAHDIYLFYSNRRPEDAAFLDELTELARRFPRFHFIPTMSEMQNSQRSWQGETGWIDRAMLERHLPTLQGPIYYIAGPPEMVAGMQKILIAAGVDEDDLRMEEFAGY